MQKKIHVHPVWFRMVLPIDLVPGAEALLVSLQRLLELQRPVEGSFIRQQPLQGAGDAFALPGRPGGPAAA